jgi:sugar lactone lactonase YvrE
LIAHRSKAATCGLAVLAALALAVSAAAESRFEQYRRLRHEADVLAGRDDRAAAGRLTAASALFPAGPGTLILLAAAEARAGDSGAAVAVLDRYARLGLTLDLAARPELAALQARPDFAPVARRLAANARPKGRLLWSAAIAGRGPLEGVAWDPRTGRLFVGLVGGRAVLAGGPETGFESLTRAAEVGAGVFGLAWDARRGVLWAVAAVGEQAPGSENEEDASALLRIDPDDGEVQALYGAPSDARLGDLVLGPDGTVYVSDSLAGQVLRLKPGAPTLERFVASPELGSAQGMAVRGRALIVADYATGLHRVDLDSGVVEPIAVPAGLAAAGIDGLADDGRSLYATQNGTTPQRILRLTLSKDGRRVTRARVLMAARPDAPDLALLAIAGDELVFSARSGWADGASPVLAAIAIR